MKDKKRWKFANKNAMKCLRSGEQVEANEVVRDCSGDGYSSQSVDGEQRVDTGNIEEAESSLRGGVCLNYEEARALLGRLEYQRGNIEAALRVFDGIDVAAIAPKIKISLRKRTEKRKSYSKWDAPPMSIHAVSLLLEALYLKAKSLQELGRFKEGAQTCNIILDTVESALAEGLPDKFSNDYRKLHEIVCKAVESVPELWQLAGYPSQTILSYRRALLGFWNLDVEISGKIQKEFATFLLYGGCDANPPNLRAQMDGSFVPRNNIEEAILLLMILLRKCSLKKIAWDPSILHHLTFAFSVSGQLRSLAHQVEELLPGVIDRKERYYNLALCYLCEGEDLVALNLLKKLLSASEDPNCLKGLLLASKICGNNSLYAEQGVSFARRALASLNGACDLIQSVGDCLLGISLSAQAKLSISEQERVSRQSEALEALERAMELTKGKDYNIIYNLSLENAEQRKLGSALRYVKQLMKMEGGCNVKSWILLARVLSAEKRYSDAEAVVNAALDETGKWNQGQLLHTKAKLQIAQHHLKEAVETFTQLLAVLQLRAKSSRFGTKPFEGGQNDRYLEMETWHELASVYIFMGQWRDVEVCISKLKAISPYSALVWHATGKLQEARGLLKDAFAAYSTALDIEPNHVPSLVSKAIVLRELGGRPLVVVRNFLADALRIDRTNHTAWFCLGQLHEAEGGQILEAADCFQAAALLQETAPVEPFR